VIRRLIIVIELLCIMIGIKIISFKKPMKEIARLEKKIMLEETIKK